MAEESDQNPFSSRSISDQEIIPEEKAVSKKKKKVKSKKIQGKKPKKTSSSKVVKALKPKPEIIGPINQELSAEAVSLEKVQMPEDTSGTVDLAEAEANDVPKDVGTENTAKDGEVSAETSKNSSPALAAAVKPAVAPLPSPEPIDEWMIRRVEAALTLYSNEDTQKILDYLLKLELLSAEQIDHIKHASSQEGVDLIDTIIQNNFMKEKEAGTAIAAFFNCTYISFKGVGIPSDVISIIPKQVSESSGVIVFDVDSDVIKVAMLNPRNIHFIHLLEKKTGKLAQIHFTTPSQIEEALKSYPSEFEDRLDSLMARANANLSHLDTLTNVSEVFDSLVLMAFQRGASDVHIEPFDKEIRIRFRIDGVLNIVSTLPSKFIETIINHIKVLAHLRIDTHNASQDGRFHVTYGKTTINFRVSIMPTHYGEKAVLRLLTSETQEWSLNELGYLLHDQEVIERSISKTNGMILVSGPTGSGKTTTLYAILKQLNNDEVNISTIEDPIEYGLPGIMQTQINTRTNITYAEGLKSLMRQDPDILMIGEIRDFETGKIAVNAALTGHIVLSTVHTNNASLAPLRLLQMGVDPYLITTTVDLIVAQRLVRKICQNCKSSFVMMRSELDELIGQFALDEDQKALFDKFFASDKDGIRLFKGSGCDQCGDSGFHGRSVIAETLRMKDNIRQLIMNNKTEAEIQAAAQENGMTIMLEDGLAKVKDGLTTLEEVFRVINQ